jgi:hypothetical protein
MDRVANQLLTTELLPVPSPNLPHARASPLPFHHQRDLAKETGALQVDGDLDVLNLPLDQMCEWAGSAQDMEDFD